jgi:MYXO-CTERM domain-containing protein
MAIVMRRTAFAFVALAAFVPTPADAAKTLFGREIVPRRELSAEEIAARRAAFEENLVRRGMVKVGDRIMRDPSIAVDTPVQHGAGWEDPPHYATIYLNFFGGMLTSGTIASEMQSGCVGGIDIDYPMYQGTNMQALTMIQVFENAMAPYAVRIAYEEAPPAHLPYSMVMMGGDPTDIGQDAGTLGVSCSSDCGDVWWRDTTFAFTEASNSALTLGNTALQEAAHAFGLDHIDDSDHIMYPFASGGTKVWAQECTPYNDATGGISCTYIHDVFCGEDAGMQNDHAELMAYFGPNEPDVEPPVVTIVSPADGDELPSGASVGVEAEISDNHEGYGWRLRVVPEGGEELVAPAYEKEMSWTFDVPDGTYDLYVEAIDHDGNEGSAVVRVYVGGGAPAETTGDVDDTGPDPTEDPSDTEDSDEAEGGDSEGTGPAIEDPMDPEGCACGVTAPHGAALGLLVLAPLRRRRRRQ